MSEIKENVNDEHPQSIPGVENLKDFYLKELETTHGGCVCINYNSEYLRERLSKLKEESNTLRQKIIQIENQNLKEKNELENIILSLKENNNNLKLNYESQKKDIDNLSKDKQNLLNELNEIKNINNNLVNDRDMLLGQIQELNHIISNSISPKLRINENDLMSLQNKINELEKTILSLKNEKRRLLNDNNNKNELIKILTNQNKNLLNEIKMKYNKDLLFIKSIEKIGIEENIHSDIQEIINKYDVHNDNENINYSKMNNKNLYHSYNNNYIINNDKNFIKMNRNRKYSNKKIKEKLNKTEYKEE